MQARSMHRLLSLIHYQNRLWRCPQKNFRLWTTPVGLESQIMPLCAGRQRVRFPNLCLRKDFEGRKASPNE